MKAPRLICILGAESTGKTTLAESLANHFGCPWVSEYLRHFCVENARTPRCDEQALVIHKQRDAEIAALARATAQQDAYVFCDTAPLLTAIYSDFIFGDRSLHTQARALHLNYALTLLLAPDLSWIADSLQRDGEHVREPVTRMIKQELYRLALPFVSIQGQDEKRLAAAINAIKQLEVGPETNGTS